MGDIDGRLSPIGSNVLQLDCFPHLDNTLVKSLSVIRSLGEGSYKIASVTLGEGSYKIPFVTVKGLTRLLSSLDADFGKGLTRLLSSCFVKGGRIWKCSEINAGCRVVECLWNLFTMMGDYRPCNLRWAIIAQEAYRRLTPGRAIIAQMGDLLKV